MQLPIFQALLELGYYNANGTSSSSSSIVETLPIGTFLSIDGGDYASIADTSKTYHVDVDGIRDGKFALTVNITGSGGKVVTLQYPETAVRNGTTMQMYVNADIIAAQVSNNNSNAGAVANATTTTTNISTVPPALVVNDNNGSNSRSVLPQVTVSHVQVSNASSANSTTTTVTATSLPFTPGWDVCSSNNNCTFVNDANEQLDFSKSRVSYLVQTQDKNGTLMVHYQLLRACANQTYPVGLTLFWNMVRMRENAQTAEARESSQKAA
jgi:hypothetical protein